LKFGECFAAKAGACAFQCLPAFGTCIAESISSPVEMAKCSFTLVSCLIKDYRSTQVDEVNEGIIQIIKECHQEKVQCLADAHDWKSKVNCFKMFGKCFAVKAGVCAMECVLHYKICIADAGPHPITWTKCLWTMGKCLIRQCNAITPASNDEIEALGDTGLSIENADNGIIEIIKECHEAKMQCLAEAPDLKSKALCFLKFGGCFAAKAGACALQCLPDFGTCMLESISSPVEMAKCGFTLASCLIKDCSAAVEETTPVSNDYIIEKFRQVA